MSINAVFRVSEVIALLKGLTTHVINILNRRSENLAPHFLEVKIMRHVRIKSSPNGPHTLI